MACSQRWKLLARLNGGEHPTHVPRTARATTPRVAAGASEPLHATQESAGTILQGAEEFRAAKRARDGVGEKLQPLPPAKRQRGVAFGSGVADEDDVYGMVSMTQG